MPDRRNAGQEACSALSRDRRRKARPPARTAPGRGRRLTVPTQAAGPRWAADAVACRAAPAALPSVHSQPFPSSANSHPISPQDLTTGSTRGQPGSARGLEDYQVVAVDNLALVLLAQLAGQPAGGPAHQAGD